MLARATSTQHQRWTSLPNGCLLRSAHKHTLSEQHGRQKQQRGAQGSSIQGTITISCTIITSRQVPVWIHICWFWSKTIHENHMMHVAVLLLMHAKQAASESLRTPCQHSPPCALTGGNARCTRPAQAAAPPPALPPALAQAPAVIRKSHQATAAIAAATAHAVAPTTSRYTALVIKTDSAVLPAAGTRSMLLPKSQISTQKHMVLLL